MLQPVNIRPLHVPVVHVVGGGGGVARGRHWPPWQVLLPPQLMPSFVAGNEQAPVAGLQLLLLSVVQALPSLQVTGVPGAQRPPWQVSAPLQALPSEQLLVLFVWTQPCCAVQVSLVQGLLSLQFSCWQLKTQLPPPWQTCPVGQFLAALSCPLSQVWN